MALHHIPAGVKGYSVIKREHVISLRSLIEACCVEFNMCYQFKHTGYRLRVRYLHLSEKVKSHMCLTNQVLDH